MRPPSDLSPTGVEPAWVTPFLDALAAGHPIQRAARVAHVGLSHVYAYRASNPAFHAAWQARRPPHSPIPPPPAEEWQQVVTTAMAKGCSVREIADRLRLTLRERTARREDDVAAETAALALRADRSRSKHRTDWQASFLEALEVGQTVIAACVVVGIVPNTAYSERRRNQAFGIAWAALHHRQQRSGRLLPSDWQAAFLRALAHTSTVLAACRHVDVAVSTVYDERQRNPEFAHAWDRLVAARRDTRGSG